MVGYGRRPSFEPFAPGQKSMAERVRYNIVHTGGALRRAAQDENMLAAWLEDEEEGTKKEEAKKKAWDEAQARSKRLNERKATTNESVPEKEKKDKAKL